MVGSTTRSRRKSVEAELVQHFRRPVRGSAPGEVHTTVRQCLAAAAESLTRRPVTAPLPPAAIAGAAVRWAREGTELACVLEACREVTESALEYLAAQSGKSGTRPDEVLTGARLLLRCLDMVTAAASSAYVDEHRVIARDHQTTAQTLVAALLSGHGVTELARRANLRVAPAYQVMALAIPQHPGEFAAGIDAMSAARRKLRRVQAALGTPLGSRALSLLRADGGTVLVPLEDGSPAGSATEPVMTAEVLTMVSEAAEVGLTAAIASGPTGQVPELAARTHEVLDRLCAMGQPPGLYRLIDTATGDVAARTAKTKGASACPEPEPVALRRSPSAATRGRPRPGRPGAA